MPLVSGQCTFCQGSGKCEECHGSGINPHLNSSEPKCAHCSGNGICPECEGTGKSSMHWRQYKGNLLLCGTAWAAGLIAFFALMSIVRNRCILTLFLIGWSVFWYVLFYRDGRGYFTSGRKLMLTIIVALISGAVAFAGWHLRGLMLLGYMDSAIGSLHTVVDSEQEYAKAHPETGFTCQPVQLSPNALKRLKAHDWNGYTFELIGCGVSASGKPNTTYQVLAHPLKKELPAYCSDQSGTLIYDEDGSIQNCLQKLKLR